MQLTIDTHTESPRALRLYADILRQLAQFEIEESERPFVPARMQWPEGIKEGALTSAPPPPAPVVNGPFVPSPPVPPLATVHSIAPSVAPAAAAVDSPTTAANGCDSTGLPWDERIHSSGENKLNSDGTWRQKRGANPMLVASVTAELRGRASAAVPLVPPVRPLQVGDILTPVSLPLPVPPPPPTVPVDLPPAAAAPAAVLPTAPASAVGTVPAAVTFTQLFAAANRHGFDNDRLTAIVVKAGGTGLESLVNNAALIAIVYQMVQESVNAQ